ncbi:MAG: hypothetical protein H0Z33_08290 [Bacillaceae bacterium]|nr:hypothetical protein [Bacillaceae bacterium]
MRKRLQLMAVFLLGMLAGASFMLFYIGPRIEELKYNNNLLQKQNDDLQKQVADLEETNQKHRHEQQTIQNIIVNVGQDDKMNDLELEVAKKIKRDVEWMIGLSIEGMTEFHQGIHTLFQNKKYDIDEKRVTVNLKTLIIQQNVYLYVSAEVENN